MSPDMGKSHPRGKGLTESIRHDTWSVADVSGSINFASSVVSSLGGGLVGLSSVLFLKYGPFSLLFLKNILLESITSYHDFKSKNHSRPLLTGYRSKHFTLAVG